MKNSEDMTLPLFVISIDRNMTPEFERFEEFKISYECVTPIDFSQTLKRIITSVTNDHAEFTIIATNNHQFNDTYNKKLLIPNLIKANEYSCDILCGGVGTFNIAVPVTGSLLWIDNYSSCNFVAIYRSFYEKILNHDNITSIDSLSSLTANKMVVYPFISTYLHMHREVHGIGIKRVNKSISERFVHCENKIGIYLDAYNRFL